MVALGKSSTRKRRKAPFPQNSILDRQALLDALDQEEISLKPVHIDGFYQALHRQHYPPLDEFVKNYYKHERREHVAVGPLKNAVSNRKNKNLVQLPKVFLDYLSATNDFVTLTSKIQQKLISKDRSTTKLVIELYDGQVVESVLMRYDRKGRGRASLCVSSQCGCAMGW